MSRTHARTDNIASPWAPVGAKKHLRNIIFEEEEEPCPVGAFCTLLLIFIDTFVFLSNLREKPS